MFWNVYLYELKETLRRPILYAFLLLGVLGGFFFASNTDSGNVIFFPLGQIWHNAPFVIAKLLAIVTAYGLLFTVVIVGPCVHKDFEHRCQDFFFASGVSKAAYLWGRFWGAFSGNGLIYLGVLAGLVLGNLNLPPSMTGPHHFSHYLKALFVLGLPNLLFSGAICFAFITVTRQQVTAYVAVIVALVLYLSLTTIQMLSDHHVLGPLADPFGVVALDEATRYWSVSQLNTLSIPLAGPVVMNRLVWLSITSLVFWWCHVRFRFESNPQRKSRQKNRRPAAREEQRPVLGSPVSSQPLWSWSGSVRAWWALTRESLGRTVLHPSFLILSGLTVLLTLVNFVLGLKTEGHYTNPAYPLTSWFIPTAATMMDIMIIPITVFFSGWIVWREKEDGSSELYDALPLPNWALAGSKMATLLGLQMVLVLLVVLAGLGVQWFHFQFDDVQLLVYVKLLLGIHLSEYMLLGLAAIFFQVIAPNRYLGFLFTGCLISANFLLGRLGFDAPYFRYGQMPDYLYSNMNGLGPFAEPMVWFSLYWWFFAGMLGLVTYLVWQRGNAQSLAERLKTARGAFKGSRRLYFVLLFCGWSFSGLFLFFNTHIRNRGMEGEGMERFQVAMEKEYKHLAQEPQPRITDVAVSVDIFPRRRSVHIEGTYELENKNQVPVQTVYVRSLPKWELLKLSLQHPNLRSEDLEMGWYSFQLKEPLMPGEATRLDFQLKCRETGFHRSEPNLELVANGSYFDNLDYFPHIGYHPGMELEDPQKRESYGLPPKVLLPSPIEPGVERHHIISNEADKLNFEARVSTVESQVALAPGLLVNRWTEGGRNYFHYRAEVPIHNLFCFLSAEFRVAQDQWNGVAIEVYYHPDHHYNVQRMIRAAKASLDYASKYLGPYPHSVLRIVEFPLYRKFAQSFPSTITFSESMGFVARLDGTEAVDYVSFVTAHEVAHQWWGHQVTAAAAQGAPLIMETLSQYTAAMILKDMVGETHYRSLLQKDMDTYLRNRSRQKLAEVALEGLTNQPHLHYHKGLVVMGALADYLGEEVLNHALREFMEEFRDSGAPYPRAQELLSYLEKATPHEFRYLVEDLFKTVTFYDNRVDNAYFEKLPNGSYQVDLEVTALRTRADGGGQETPISGPVWAEIGIFGEGGTALYLQHHPIQSSPLRLQLEVDQKPYRAGIDPRGVLIDRNQDDNEADVLQRQQQENGPS